MNLYENVATESIASIFYNESKWKKELIFDFLLNPFGLTISDVLDVKTQDKLKETTPDFTIVTKNKEIHFEVKINDAALSDSEKDKKTRDAFLVRKCYAHLEEIPLEKEYVLFWEDLFDMIDKKEASNEFARLALVREYMREDIHTLLLTPHEVAMFYSPDTVYAVYKMSQKIVERCENILES